MSCMSCLFFIVILAKVCQFCLFLGLMIVFYYRFGLHYNDFYSDFYYILPFTNLESIYSSFPISFRCDIKLRFFLALRKGCVSVNILLILLWLYPIDFGTLHFHFCLSSGVFLISLLISSLTQ